MGTRRFDIDWLRVIAIGFLLIFHVAIPFQPYGVFFGFIQNQESMESLMIPMSLLSVWRIPLLFFVSGMGVYFSMRKRNWGQLIGERARRIFLPLLVGIFTIVPLQNLLWQHYYHQELSPVFQPAHLWFLGNIFTYVLILTPLLYLSKKYRDHWRPWVVRQVNHPLKLLLFCVPLVLNSLWLQPEPYTLYAMTLHGYILGGMAFLLGYLFVYAGECFWETVSGYKWIYLLLALMLFGLRWYRFELESPGYLMAVETFLWVYAILGIGYTFLNRSNATLKYLSEAAYPIYIVHWLFINLGAFWLFPTDMPVELKFAVLTVFTFTGSLLFYHVLIRQVILLRPLFGLKSKPAYKPYPIRV